MTPEQRAELVNAIARCIHTAARGPNVSLRLIAEIVVRWLENDEAATVAMRALLTEGRI